MNTVSAYQASLTGIQTGIKSMNKATFEIARSNGDSEQLTTSIVDLNAHAQQVTAAAKALKINHDTLDTVLDIKV